ncbi:hypothetical protein GG344DRAFT_83645 [Lentinula edodes]|nr:hypothetical protein GG344DRAFT_83645 [Lentinula edodes]
MTLPPPLLLRASEEVAVAFLRRGLDSDDLDVVVRQGSLSYDHAGFVPPPDDSVEPPLYRRMLVLSTALPHSNGVGRWDDVVPALPSVDQLTADWEQLMLRYIHHITNTPLSDTDAQGPISSVESATESLAEVLVEWSLGAPFVLEPTSSVVPHPQVPLFLPEQELLNSPSPTLPPLFGSVTNLAIDLTGDDDELYEMEEASAGRLSVEREVIDLAAGKDVVKDESW